LFFFSFFTSDVSDVLNAAFDDNPAVNILASQGADVFSIRKQDFKHPVAGDLNVCTIVCLIVPYILLTILLI